MRAALGLIPIVLFLILATHFCFSKGVELDDAGYVSLRVAENLRTGQGLIFNAGERRDLTDSPLWISQLSLLTFSNNATLNVQAFGLLLGVLTLLVVLLAPRVLWVGVGAAFFLSLDGLYVSRVTSGSGEVLAGLFLVLLYPIFRSPRSTSASWTDADKFLCLWSLLAPLARYEFILVSIPVALGAGLRERSRLFAWTPLLAALLGGVIILGLRWHYFSSWPAYWEPWPPRSQSMWRAFGHLLLLLVRRPLLLVALLVFFSEWIHGRLWLGRKVGLAWGLAALLIFQLAPAEGHDLEKHVHAALPLAYLLAVRAIWRTPPFRPVLVAALLLLVAQPNWTAKDPSPDAEKQHAYARLGQYLRTHALPGTVVGAHRVGALGLYSHLKMEDVGGRVSPRVARARRQLREQGSRSEAFEAMLRQEPDLVFVLPSDPVPSSDIYVPNDEAIPSAIRGPFLVYRWAGSPVWVHTVAGDGH